MAFFVKNGNEKFIVKNVIEMHCVAIKQDGLRCSLMTGVEREHGGIRCVRHWAMLSESMDIYGVERGLVHHAGMEARLIRHGPHVRQLAEERNRRRAEWIAAHDVEELGHNVRVPIGELERFAMDNQNVHTVVAVNKTKEIVKKVLEIPVPLNYQWNMRKISKTPGAIIINCGLSINAGRIMIDRYTLDENIYEMGNGIYGKVLDGVWQYIKNSKDKEDLCKILGQELKDNVGMCLQGNLSRLCNVLAGYMDNMSQESVAEILGREFAKLMEIEDVEERKAKGNKILDDNNVIDAETRKAWVGAL